MKFFNTAGPVNQPEHYKIDPLQRWDLEEILFLIEQKKYFVLHAPRQTGKTSCLLALRDLLNAEGKYGCVYANFEVGQTARENVASGITAVLSQLRERVRDTFGSDPVSAGNRELIAESDANDALGTYLSRLCEKADKPVILFVDEIDALIGDTLVSVLRQLRSRYDKRPQEFPQSIILCGVRDIRDYRIHSSGKDIITGGSAFNIKAKSLSLGDFSAEEVKALYGEHTKETGQVFDPGCFPLVMEYTGGQPWLVNALGYEVTFEMKANRDRSVAITPAMLTEAKERLILARTTHLDQLAHKLSEVRVRRVIEPLLIGEVSDVLDDDIEYCRDLGLITRTGEGWKIANRIYQEVIPRELGKISQDKFLSVFRPEWVTSDGALNTEKLFSMFQTFWRENSDIWKEDMAGYLEAAPHLTFQAFLQRVANGNGTIAREYAYGTRRADLALTWRSGAGEQRVVIELKMLTERDTLEKVKAVALEQTAAYADTCDATEANVVIFDRTGKAGWKEKVFRESCSCGNRVIRIWGM